jgi:hypothetical protein
MTLGTFWDARTPTKFAPDCQAGVKMKKISGSGSGSGLLQITGQYRFILGLITSVAHNVKKLPKNSDKIIILF